MQHGITVVELMLSVAIVAILAAIAVPAYQNYIDRARLLQAANDIGAISTDVARFALDNRRNPTSLAEVGRDRMRDPWGNGYQYVNHEDPMERGRFRRDKRIVPINTDFDVFSNGKDGDSLPPLTAKVSRDDIVRANDGAFVGLASEYDP
jgi:general secretion pathway protein G